MFIVRQFYLNKLQVFGFQLASPSIFVTASGPGRDNLGLEVFAL